MAGRRTHAARPRVLPQGPGVLALQQKHAKAGLRIDNDLQTNGTRLDEDWARFLKEHGFLVGLSIDGPREIHDRYRITKRGAPTFDTVYAAAKMLQRFGVKFNTLTCVNRFNASRPLDVYRFLRRDLGSTYLQFIPIVEIKGFETTAPQTWNTARLPVVSSPEARPGHPNSVVTDWSVDRSPMRNPRSCRRIEGGANFFPTAGASARRIACCARRRANRASTISARDSSGSSLTRCPRRQRWRHGCARRLYRHGEGCEPLRSGLRRPTGIRTNFSSTSAESRSCDHHWPWPLSKWGNVRLTWRSTVRYHAAVCLRRYGCGAFGRGVYWNNAGVHHTGVGA